MLFWSLRGLGELGTEGQSFFGYEGVSRSAAVVQTNGSRDSHWLHHEVILKKEGK